MARCLVAPAPSAARLDHDATAVFFSLRGQLLVIWVHLHIEPAKYILLQYNDLLPQIKLAYTKKYNRWQ
jgi:hypothetical protein